MYWLVASMFYGLAASRSLWVASAALSETDRGRNDRCRGISPVRLPAAPGAPHRGLSVGEVQSENMTHTHTHTHKHTHTWMKRPFGLVSLLIHLALSTSCPHTSPDSSGVNAGTLCRESGVQQTLVPTLTLFLARWKWLVFWGMCCLLKSFED